MRVLAMSAALLILVAVTPASAQDQRPAAPSSSQTAPNAANSAAVKTLEDTLNFIAAKIKEQGELKFIAYWRKREDSSAGLSELSDDLRGTTFDAAGCRVNYVWRSKFNGKAFDDIVRPFDLKSVRHVQLMNEVKSLNYDGTATKNVTKVSQPITEVWLAFDNSPVRQFWFHNPEDAEAVALAFTRAVELCGGLLQD